MDRLNRLEQDLVNEQAEKLFKICDTDEKGFIVRADLPKLDGLIPNVSFNHLEEFFNASDLTRTSMVNKKDFINGIKPLLLTSSNHLTSKDFMKARRSLTELPVENFRTISLETEDSQSPRKFTHEYRSKLSIAIGSPSEQDSTSRGLAKSVMTPSVSSSSLEPYLDVHVHERKLTNKLDANTPEGRNITEELRTPDRIYKVVFVGDSAVGKTCFLHRYCHNRFKPLFNATIGVDFTVKNVKVNDRVVAVQLWDTAGQERFRSITKQYFRKADAVVMLYDVTSEQSFINVRNWLDAVYNGVDEGCVMCLVGNKVDLCPDESARLITYKDGKNMASEFDMIYFETSAFSGLGITECMQAIALKLLQRDEDIIEEALKLEADNDTRKSSWCCV